MYKVLSTEILKLKRSAVILFSLIISFMPALIKFLQYSIVNRNSSVDWKWFISEHQEFAVFGMLTAVILISCFVFGVEYHNRTISYLFTSCTSRSNIFLGKIIILFVLITLLLGSSMISFLIFGYLTVKKTIPTQLLLKYAEVTIYSILSFFSLTALMAFVTMQVKKYAISSALILGYIMMVFPFHLKNNSLICPFMLPAVISAKIFKSNNYIFKDYYRTAVIDYPLLAGAMVGVFVITILIGMVYYRKVDVT